MSEAARCPCVLVAEEPVAGRGPDARRVRHRADVLARLGGGVLLAPVGIDGPIDVEGITHLAVDAPPGIAPDRRATEVEDRVGPWLDRLRPPMVHIMGLRSAIPALMRRRGGLRVIVEPGITPAQRLRDEDPDTPAARLETLVELEEKTLTRADGVVARSTIEAAVLCKRGVSSNRLVVVRDGIPSGSATADLSELPQLVYVGRLEPWCGWELALDALARVQGPWRLTALVPHDAPAGLLVNRARALGIAHRVSVARWDDGMGARVEAAQMVLCTLMPTRVVVAGAIVPDAVLWAAAYGRPLVAPDLPVVRFYAGPAARYFAAGNATELAAAIEQIASSQGLRAQLMGATLEQRRRLSWHDADIALTELWRDFGVAE